MVGTSKQSLTETIIGDPYTKGKSVKYKTQNTRYFQRSNLMDHDSDEEGFIKVGPK